MNQRISDALVQLERVNKGTIRAAGPRYTPGVDSTAPNIAIGYLVDAFDALSLVNGWRGRTQGLADGINKAVEHQTYRPDRLFRRYRATPVRLIEQVQALQTLQEPVAIRRAAVQLRRNSELVVGRLREEGDALWEQIRALPDKQPDHENRNRLQSDARAVRDVTAAVQELIDYLDGPPGRFLRGANGLLLLGSWGTGKTHLLCDMARQRIGAGAPALLVMASSLPSNTDILTGIATTTGLAASGAELLSELNRLGAATNTRALLMVDAINEGDRELWHQQLASLTMTVSHWPHVGLVVSCRQPFNDGIVTNKAAKQLLSLEHYGFQDQEFDAQLEYFSFYDLPALSVPLITPEFSRPLFLKILCEGLKDLGRQSQRRKLREVASGQKGLTYLLERFTKKVGKGIESDLGLARGSCWIALKGNQADSGLAGRMATQGSDWLSTEDAIVSLESSLSLPRPKAEDALRRFINDGLLVDVGRRHDSQDATAIQFSYQLFGDHLIARHLLEEDLSTKTAQELRRCFYRNRPLGQPFRLDRWGQQFEAPGIAAALMLEFPERMKHSALSHELLTYLPKATRRVPMVKVFLDGLYWRSADAFTEETDRIVNYFLARVDDSTRDATFEVLVGLATRPTHWYSARRLFEDLSGETMASRDQSWSEFLRRSDEQGNVQRFLAWAERSTERDELAVRNEVRLLSLLLTTTNRPLRDRATRVLVIRGSARPDVLFDEALLSLAFNDPYVSERMLAAAYGIAMRLWADPDGVSLREAIVPFAQSLVRQMFVPSAPHATKHVLQRGYALGVIALARRINPQAIASRQVALLRPPFAQIPSPFVDPTQINEVDVDDSRRATDGDFANYTIGPLIPDRDNYQDSHPEYQDVRRQIARRMSDLGYSAATFSDLDASIAHMQPLSRAADAGKIDRYGKKYAWIAFFEMYGVRNDLDLLGESRSGERTPDCDVDPSFPDPPQEWVPPLPDFFTGAPTDHAEWLATGPIPDYEHLLVLPQIDGVEGGPWVLLDAFIQEVGSSDRKTFTFIRGLFMRQRDIDRVGPAVATSDYLGSRRVPEPGDDYYTFAGEIPWSPLYADDYRRKSGRARRNVSRMLPRFSGGRCIASGRAEVPVHRWAWENHHSSLNQVSGVTFPAVALCEQLGLVNRKASFDLWDRDGHQASVYREFDVADRYGESNLLYLRQDLLERYLSLTDQKMIWIPWGERTLHYKHFTHGRPAPAIQAVRQSHQNNFGELVEYSSRRP